MIIVNPTSPEYKCEKHGNIGKLCFYISFVDEQITEKFCLKCLNEVLKNNCCIVEKISYES